MTALQTLGLNNELLLTSWEQGACFDALNEGDILYSFLPRSAVLADGWSDLKLSRTEITFAYFKSWTHNNGRSQKDEDEDEKGTQCFPSFLVQLPHDVRSDLNLRLFSPQEKLTFVVASEAIVWSIRWTSTVQLAHSKAYMDNHFCTVLDICWYLPWSHLSSSSGWSDKDHDV